jgi:hypothetical protein
VTDTEETFEQRLFSLLKELADLRAIKGKDDISALEVVSLVDKYVADDDVPTDGLLYGRDRAKLLLGIKNAFEETSNEALDAVVDDAITESKAMRERTEKVLQMDQIDHFIHGIRHDVQANEAAIAYLTAVLNNDTGTAHEIIDEEGYGLVHTLTEWFLGWMGSGRSLEAHPEGPTEMVRDFLREIAMSLATVSATTDEQHRAALEAALEAMNRPYDQDGPDAFG